MIEHQRSIDPRTIRAAPRLTIDSAVLDRVNAALADIRAGKMIILVDDEDRENEGDLVLAAEKVTPEAINFMAKYGARAHLLSRSTKSPSARSLDLPMMRVPRSGWSAARHGLHREHRGSGRRHHRDQRGGSRAHDRGRPSPADAKPTDLVTPGHVFPLKRTNAAASWCGLARPKALWIWRGSPGSRRPGSSARS